MSGTDAMNCTRSSLDATVTPRVSTCRRSVSVIVAARVLAGPLPCPEATAAATTSCTYRTSVVDCLACDAEQRRCVGDIGRSRVNQRPAESTAVGERVSRALEGSSCILAHARTANTAASALRLDDDGAHSTRCTRDTPCSLSRLRLPT